MADVSFGRTVCLPSNQRHRLNVKNTTKIKLEEILANIMNKSDIDLVAGETAEIYIPIHIYIYIINELQNFP